MKSTTSLDRYETQQSNIKRLLKRIDSGLEVHDKECSREIDGHHWGAVGDLDYVAEQLTEVVNFLFGEGDYQE